MSGFELQPAKACVAGDAAAPGAGARPRAPTAAERPALLAWLAAGLRAGRPGRLEAENPLALAPERRDDQRALWANGSPVSHALLHASEVSARDRRLSVGMVGLVFTDPSQRGRGLAGACVEACVATLAQRGVPLAALWSDRHAFYARLGFERAGQEHHYRIDTSLCRRAWGAPAPGLAIADARANDWPALEALYRAKPVHVQRPPGALARLAAAPDTRVLVAHAGPRAVAYAALGRGDDFTGIVHEWAGAPEAVGACLAALCREHGELGWLVGPVDESPAPELRAAGARPRPGSFALVRLLDPSAVWGALVGAPGAPRLEGPGARPVLRAGRGTLALAHGEALALLFGPALPPRVAAWLTKEEAEALGRSLPWPLYLWGFDSV